MDEMEKTTGVVEPNVSFEYINPRYTIGIEDECNEVLQPISGYAKEPLLSLEEACEPLKNLVPRLETYIWVAKQNSKNPTDGLTQDESAAIRLYTMEWDSTDSDARSSLYAHLNRTLKQIDRTKLRPWFRFLKLLLTALAKLPAAPRQTVWRGVRKDYSKEYIPGSESTWWAFSSCTTSLNVLESDLYLGQIGTRTLFSIEAFNGRTIRTHSHFKLEDEVLLLPGTFFEVKSRLNPAPDLFIVHLSQKRPPHDLLEPPFEGAELLPLIDAKVDKRTRFTIYPSPLTEEDDRPWYKQKKRCFGLGAISAAILVLAIILIIVLATQMKRPIPIALTRTTTAITFSRNTRIPDPVSMANAFYAFDNNTFDLYSRRHGRIIGGPVQYVQGYVAYGKAIVFERDAPSEICIKKGFNITQNTSFTVEGFFSLSETSLNCALVQLTSMITMNITSGKLQFSLGSEVIILGNSVLSTDDWHHFGFVYDAIEQRARIFIDGAIDATNDSVTPELDNSVNNCSIIIGADFRGYIDELSITLTAKSPADILWDATTVAYYPLDISYARDKGPNGINGTGQDVMITTSWLNAALNFNSSTSVYRTGELTALGKPRKAFSIALWVRAEARAGVFLTIANAYTCLLVLGLENKTNQIIAFLPNDAAPEKSIRIVGQKMPLYRWAHVTFTWSHSNGAQIYATGYLQNNDPKAVTLNNAHGVNHSLPMTITLGHFNGTANCQDIPGVDVSNQFMGSLDELYVFSRELPIAEIREITQPPPKFPSG